LKSLNLTLTPYPLIHLQFQIDGDPITVEIFVILFTKLPDTVVIDLQIGLRVRIRIRVSLITIAHY